MQSSQKIESFFRTEAWVQAWIDTYGKDPRITLIDPFGRNHPLEIFYGIKSPVRKCLSFRTLALAGTAISPLSAPRSEYNAVLPSLREPELLSALADCSWSQIVFKDMAQGTLSDIEWLSANGGWSLHSNPSEITYYVSAPDISSYKAALTASVRARYFNRRERLKSAGSIEFRDYEISEADQFFDLLDTFHYQRWGQPCYSPVSRAFLKNFMARFVNAGSVVMQVMQLDGKPISILYDVIYRGRRYNMQSGFDERAAPGISPGALHMGYGVEAAIGAGQDYDFLAGKGKNHNYKAAIANRQSVIRTLIVQKLQVAMFRKAKQLFKFPSH